jgi:hypothetical protein
VTEAATLDELDAKLANVFFDLLEDGTEGEGYDVPVEVIATFSKRIRVSGTKKRCEELPPQLTKILEAANAGTSGKVAVTMRYGRAPCRKSASPSLTTSGLGTPRMQCSSRLDCQSGFDRAVFRGLPSHSHVG